MSNKKETIEEELFFILDNYGEKHDHFKPDSTFKSRELTKKLIIFITSRNFSQHWTLDIANLPSAPVILEKG